MSARLSENIDIDDERDVLVAYGIEISGELLRFFQRVTPPGQWMRVISVDEGTCTLQSRYDREWAAKVLRVVGTADNGCSYCAAALVERLMSVLPEIDWKQELSEIICDQERIERLDLKPQSIEGKFPPGSAW